MNLGILFAEPLVAAFAGDFRDVPGKFELTVGLTRIMFPFLSLVAIAAAYDRMDAASAAAIPMVLPWGIGELRFTSAPTSTAATKRTAEGCLPVPTSASVKTGARTPASSAVKSGELPGAATIDPAREAASRMWREAESRIALTSMPSA